MYFKLFHNLKEYAEQHPDNFDTITLDELHQFMKVSEKEEAAEETGYRRHHLLHHLPI